MRCAEVQQIRESQEAEEIVHYLTTIWSHRNAIWIRSNYSKYTNVHT